MPRDYSQLSPTYDPGAGYEGAPAWLNALLNGIMPGGGGLKFPRASDYGSIGYPALQSPYGQTPAPPNAGGPVDRLGWNGVNQWLQRSLNPGGPSPAQPGPSAVPTVPATGGFNSGGPVDPTDYRMWLQRSLMDAALNPGGGPPPAQPGPPAPTQSPAAVAPFPDMSEWPSYNAWQNANRPAPTPTPSGRTSTAPATGGRPTKARPSTEYPTGKAAASSQGAPNPFTYFRYDVPGRGYQNPTITALDLSRLFKRA